MHVSRNFILIQPGFNNDLDQTGCSLNQTVQSDLSHCCSHLKKKRLSHNVALNTFDQKLVIISNFFTKTDCKRSTG